MAAKQSPESKIPVHKKTTALTIAGSDPSGGAGLQADLKTFEQLGVFGMSVVTLITAQNTQGVQRIETLAPDLIVDQLQSVLTDIRPLAIKTGALGSAEIIRKVSTKLAGLNQPIVVDPVLVSKHGDSLAGDDVVEAYRETLLRHATIVTPNRFEAERLTGIQLADDASMESCIHALFEMGAEHVLLKLGEENGESIQMLAERGTENWTKLAQPRLKTTSNHGSGCVLAAAIAGLLAAGVEPMIEVCDLAIGMTFNTINADCQLGKGKVHPVDTRFLSKMQT